MSKLKLSALHLAIGSSLLSGLAFNVNAVEESSGDEIERISVTGSKIKRIGASAPTPVVVISRTEMEDAGISNVNDFLAEMPSVSVGLSPENSNGFIYANGLNTTDLRGLGSDRTLVLVNGRRFIPGQAGGNAVDLNNIATSFIDRIEISTGGASAVYGADAVAGVVNIITRKSFEGIEVDIATTRPNEGGGKQTFGSITFGKEEKDSGFIFNFDYADQEQMRSMDKAWYRDAVEVRPNPLDRTNDDGIPGSIQHYQGEHYGLYDESSDFFIGEGGMLPENHFTFDENGNVRQFNIGSGRQEVGPDQRQPWNYVGEFGDGIAYGDDEFIRTPLKRFTLNIGGHQSVGEEHDLSFDMTYSKSDAFGQSTPIFLRTSDLNIRRDNAYIKQDLADMMDDAGVTSLGMRRLSDDFGPRKYSQSRNTVRASVGLDGMIDDNWSYNVYFQHGQMTQDTSWYGEILEENLQNALDAVNIDGEIVCADRNDAGEVIGAIDGCSTVNFLGKNSLSAEASDYISTVATAEFGHKQTSLGGTINGDLYELPAGPLQVAVSYDWRKDRAYEAPGTGIRKGIIFGNSGDSYEGEVTVKEYSAELLIPVVVDQFMADEVNIELAYRYMDYSSTGTDSAYKLGLTWTINDDLRFRMAQSQSVRAPTINELYSKPGAQFRPRTDICDAERIADETDYQANVIANCAAAGIPADWKPSEGWYNGGSLEGTLGGNPDLVNEISKDTTIGFVYSPSFLEGFDITVDYWTFDIDKAIQFYSYGSSNENCYRSDSENNAFCEAFTRDAVTHEVNGYLEASLNAATEKLSGVDLESVYGFETSFGEFNFKLVATYIEENITNGTGAAIDDRTHAGEDTKPRWRARFNSSYTYDDFRVVLTTNYRHNSVWDRNTWSIEENDYNDIESYTTFDLNATYSPMEKVNLRLGMQNLTDETPVRNFNVIEDGDAYDVIGRRITAGINVQF